MNLTEAMESSLDEMREPDSSESKNSIQGLGKIALAIINLLHELLERQAIRRMENGTLTEDEIERVGQGLMLQSDAIDKLCRDFGVSREDLNIDLGPLGKLV
ncbi:MAG: gas vesicle protein K [Pirellula sp.]|jgi:hypothetical protein|nr:gas vesicle protein K [Pirellula sp.]